MKPKLSPSLPILKEGRYSSPNKGEKNNDTKDRVCAGLMLLFLHLMIDIPLDRDYVEWCQIILTRLLSAIKQADSNVVVAQYKAQPTYSGKEEHCPMN